MSDDIFRIDISDVNNINFSTEDGISVLFGQSDSVEEKVSWINKMLPELISKGKVYGVLDVSAGEFATYRLNEDYAAQQEANDPKAQGAPAAGEGLQTPENVPDDGGEG